MPKKLVLILFVLALLAAGVFGVYKIKAGKEGSSLPSAKVSSSNYQAVFLVNDQVYFGKLKDLESPYPVLEDVYYLVVSEPLQEQGTQKLEEIEQGSEEVTVEGQPSQTGAPSYTLVKLGREIHAPKDKIVINKDQILFVEDLKDDGKLVKAIIAAKEKGGTQ